MPTESAGEAAREFALERYKYILQQIHTTNENVHRFLAIYQGLTTAVVGGALALFVSYRQWNIPPETARAGMVGLMWLETVIGAFTVLLVFVGMLSWLDYRNEECDLTDDAVRKGFRARPRKRNLFRWHETYILLFIVTVTLIMWVGLTVLLLPGIK